MVKVLVVDNYDSFVFNLVQYLQQLGADVEVRRNDEVTPGEVARYDGVLLSPGPGAPEQAGVCIPMVRAAIDAGVPLLGVCLGHQAIGVAFGAVCTRAPELLHGKVSPVEHLDAGVLAGLPQPFTATRYHSLAVLEETLPDELEPTAWAVRPDGTRGVLMALRHREHDVEGVQFHPESVLTQGGHLMLGTWLTRCGSTDAALLAPALAAQVEVRRLGAMAGLSVAAS